jgi:Tol biopolymer transport system component
MKRQTGLRLAAAGGLAAVWLGLFHTSAGWAQPVVYVTSYPAGSYTMRVINADGSGDRLIPVPVLQVEVVSFSKDGRFMALTAQTPGRPAQISRNVFLLNLQTAQLQQITLFEDQVSENDFLYVKPNYHSIAPDNNSIAVWNLAATRGGTTPSLDRYRLSDGLYLGTLDYQLPLNGNNEGGSGVDYHPVQNLLVAARRVNVPLYDYYTGYPVGSTGEGTALWLYSTVWQQLTAPIGWHSAPYQANQNDYAPAFSPNGQQVAYVRALSLTYFGYQPWTLALRIVNADGTDDHQVLALPQGVYVTRVSWSRDGTQLVFDAGTQVINGNIPAPLVVEATDALYIVNTNGTGQRLLRAAPASCPVWSPTGTTFCNLPGVVVGGGVPGSATIDDCGQPIRVAGISLAPGQFRLDITGGTPNLLYRIMTSPDLRTWQSLGTLPYAGPTSSYTDTTCGGLIRRYYRVVLGDN